MLIYYDTDTQSAICLKQQVKDLSEGDENQNTW